MISWRGLLLYLMALLSIGAMAWRIAVRWRNLPCPAWLSWVLDNRFTEAIGRSAEQLDRLDLQPGMRVLDAGSGPGRLTVPAAERVRPHGEVVAIDVQPAMLRKLSRRVAERNLTNVRVVVGSLGDGLLDRGYFDRALLVTVLGEIPDGERALREIYDALKPGGVLSVTEALPDPHYQTIRTVRRLAERVGFREDRVWGNVFIYTMNLVKPQG